MRCYFKSSNSDWTTNFKSSHLIQSRLRLGLDQRHLIKLRGLDQTVRAISVRDNVIKQINRKRGCVGKNLRHCLNSKFTHKNAQVVTDLQQTCSNSVSTTCQQDVFALLVPSLLTTCYKLLSSTDLLQVVPTYIVTVEVIVLQLNNISTSCE